MLVGLAAGCARAGAGGAPPSGAPVAAAGPLRLEVVYPESTAVVPRTDSIFLFGNLRGGGGPAQLAVNGVPVRVLANGAWLAWLALPDDSVARFSFVAAAGAESLRAVVAVRVAPRFRPPAGRAAWIDTTSFRPAGRIALPAGEGVRLAVRAAPAASVRLALPWGASVPLVADTEATEVPPEVRAFTAEPDAGRPRALGPRYVGWLPAAPLCADARTACATLVVTGAGDTASARWPLQVEVVDTQFPRVVRLDDDTAGSGLTDSVTPGRAVPHGTYNWFFPTGTVAVESGRWNDQVRLRLSRTALAWVNAADVVPLPPGTPPPGGAVGPVRLVPGPASVALRVPLPARLPFQVTEDDRRLTLRLYGAAADVNWIHYGGTDPFVARIDYAQPTADEMTITLVLSRPVWGYRARFAGRDLVLEVRRPPAIDAARPLRGRTIVLDPGHPPLGATGPAGVREAAVALAVARRAQALLARAGATVWLTRTDSLPVELAERTRFAERHDAEVLVSIHANALPDGINPYANNGTSVYYFHPHSAALARALDRALVAELGLRDLGMGRGDYALARPTWMPAALTEAAFMMIPEQEALLASPAGQERYARGVVRGIAAFLEERAREP